MLYLVVKVVHVLAIVSWMAGLFYLPRLMVYHSEVVVGSSEDSLFKVMERRLLAAIMRPACVVSLVTGVVLVVLGNWDASSAWVLLKLVGVVGLVVVHGFLERYVLAFAAGDRPHSCRFFRVFNEAPTVCLVVIVICVIIKPWS